MTERVYKVRTPLFPTYSEVRQLLKILQDSPAETVKSLMRATWDQMGTPQNPVDWTEPDTWIPERLSGDEAQLAERIWTESDKAINPRHIYGSYLFINSYKLLVPDSSGCYRLSERGSGFLDGEESVVRELDDLEGITQLLSILTIKTKGKRSDLLPDWAEFLQAHSKFGSEAMVRDTLRRRLANLADRGLVTRVGNVYEISPAGTSYATAFVQTEESPKTQVLQATKTFNFHQREELKQRLAKVSPYRFEKLVGDLLESIGYEDVVVTKASGDKGVDVVGTVQFGITTVKEVVQVKRHKGSIGRQVLDQLRGSLHYHGAIRGTLITLGSFSKGCKDAALFPGAAPITLIDGEKLLDLLIENKIGVKKRSIELVEVDSEYLSEEPEPNSIEVNLV